MLYHPSTDFGLTPVWGATKDFLTVTNYHHRNSSVKPVFRWQPSRRRLRGRPKKRWMGCVEEDFTQSGNIKIRHHNRWTTCITPGNGRRQKSKEGVGGGIDGWNQLCDDNLTWPDLTWPDLTWPDLTWPDPTWPDLSWHDLTWIHRRLLLHYCDNFLPAGRVVACGGGDKEVS